MANAAIWAVGLILMVTFALTSLVSMYDKGVHSLVRQVGVPAAAGAGAAASALPTLKQTGDAPATGSAYTWLEDRLARLRHDDRVATAMRSMPEPEPALARSGGQPAAPDRVEWAGASRTGAAASGARTRAAVAAMSKALCHSGARQLAQRPPPSTLASELSAGCSDVLSGWMGKVSEGSDGSSSSPEPPSSSDEGPLPLRPLQASSHCRCCCCLLLATLVGGALPLLPCARPA
jgi:hypothetical protein